jgi:hypothetical protein
MEEKITIKQAYASMYYFLENLYHLTKSDDLGGFLGGMSLLEDRKPADPAVWDDWLDAVKKACNNNNNFDDIYLKLKK